jgi:hypothetical protein
VEKNGLCDIQVVFHDDTRIEEGDGWTRRIAGAELRRVRIRGVTKSWRDTQAENEFKEAQQVGSSNGGQRLH